MTAERKPSDAEAEAPETSEAQAPESALAEAQAKADENWNLYLRAAAELDNVRKRAARDVENAHKFALESFGREIGRASCRERVCSTV